MGGIRLLSLDLETRSDVELLKSGVYRYTEGAGFAVLLIAWVWDDEPVQLADLASGEEIPAELQAALFDDAVIKAAYNANFEITCLSRHIGRPLNPASWRCTMLHAAMLGLPRSLAEVGRALRLPEDKQKMKEGRDLIRYFCVPCRPTKTNGGRTRNLPEHAPEKWETFKAYCMQDVETERAIRKRLDKYPVPDVEQQTWVLDQRINTRGVRVNNHLVRQAIHISNAHTESLTKKAEELTGLDNPNSVAQLKGWLGTEGSLDKKAVAAMRETCTDADVDRVLAIRQEMGKTSVKKYEAIQRMTCGDGRVRGLFKCYGANRTGRWTGAGLQPQNLPQNHLPDLDVARELALDGDAEALQLLYGSVPGTLSELIRTAFIHTEGHVFIVADFSAIEARVLSWLADERWRMKVFAGDGKIYEASAERMFRLPPGSVKKGDPMRQKGKISELAFGFGGSVGALTAMGALEMGLAEEELRPLVYAWHAANPAIVRLWDSVGSAAVEAIRYRVGRPLPKGMRAEYRGKMLFLTLPSGRKLCYVRPSVVEGKFGGDAVSYESTEAGKWGKASTYGPKLVENVVQAIARDCLRDALLAVEEKYPEIVMHVHDEIVVEVPVAQAEDALRDICEIMGRPVAWAPGLLLRADGYITPFYRKD